MAEDPEIGQFFLRWNLNEDAQAKVISLPPEVRQQVLKNFAPAEGMTEVNGKLILYAASIEKRFKAIGSIHELPSNKNCHLEHPDFMTDPLGAFISQWNLNSDAQEKLWKLKPDVQQAVMSGFGPPPHMTEVSGKFIMYAASIERRSSQGMWGQQMPQPHFGQPSLSNPRLPRIQANISQHQFNGGGGGGSFGGSTAPGQEELMAFALQWGLNEDATAKLFKLASGPQGLVQHIMQLFLPPPHMTEVSGKFIMFAASQEKTYAGANSGHQTNQPTHSAYTEQLWAQALEHAGHHPAAPRSFAPQPIVARTPVVPMGSDEQTLSSFCGHWGLNADAQTKLWSLTPAVQEQVMAQFAPPPHMTEVSGKFIMFAAAIDRQNGGKGKGMQSVAAFDGGKGAQQWVATRVPGAGKGKGVQCAAAFDPLEAFAQHWSLNPDAQQKLHSLSPEIQLAVMSGFGPPAHMTEVSGKFIMYAASVDKDSRGQQPGRPAPY